MIILCRLIRCCQSHMIIYYSLIGCYRSGAYKPGSKSKGTKGGVKDVKPPDLWIHHDHMELKSVKNRNDGSGRQGDAQEMKPLNDDSPGMDT